MGELSSELFGINVVVLLALLVLEIIVEVGLIFTEIEKLDIFLNYNGVLYFKKKKIYLDLD